MSLNFILDAILFLQKYFFISWPQEHLKKLPSSVQVYALAGLSWSLFLLFPTHPPAEVSKWLNIARPSKTKSTNSTSRSHIIKVMTFASWFLSYQNDPFSSGWKISTKWQISTECQIHCKYYFSIHWLIFITMGPVHEITNFHHNDELKWWISNTFE